MANRVGITVWVVFPMTQTKVNGSILFPKVFTSRLEALDYQTAMNEQLQVNYPRDDVDGRRLVMYEQDI